MKQVKLFTVSQPSQKQELSTADSSLVKIMTALKTGDWSKITDTDFTKYYIMRHNTVFKKRIVFDRYTSVTAIREGLRLRYNIQKKDMVKVINNLLDAYSKDPNCWGYLSFSMIINNIALIDRLMKKVLAQPRAMSVSLPAELKQQYEGKEVF